MPGRPEQRETGEDQPEREMRFSQLAALSVVKMGMGVLGFLTVTLTLSLLG